MGGNEYGKIHSLIYFHFFEALNGAFEVQFFSWLYFLHLIKDTYRVKGHAAQIFILKTLLNNAFYKPN